MRIAQMEPGNRLALPAEWVEELGLAEGAALEKTPHGILIHRPASSWDAVFATKLKPGVVATDTDAEAESNVLF